jgi:hypothetical protein
MSKCPYIYFCGKINPAQDQDNIPRLTYEPDQPIYGALRKQSLNIGELFNTIHPLPQEEEQYRKIFVRKLLRII